jgi:chromosome segregation protein
MRDLRSRRAEDVIFSGSQRRRAAAMAETRLVFDNGAAWLPIDGTEVEFIRRLYRSGESEYLINGHRARLRDITEAIRSAGMAGSGHTIVGQGMVDSVLSVRGAERRTFISTVAGVAPYEARRNEAMHRLELTKQNIASGQIVLDELEPRIRLLRRQSNIAQSALEARGQLKRALEWYYSTQWSTLRGDFQRAGNAAEMAEQSEMELRSKLQELEGRVHRRHTALEAVRRHRQEAIEKAMGARYSAQRAQDLYTAAHDGLKRQEHRFADLNRQFRSTPHEEGEADRIAEQDAAIDEKLETRKQVLDDISLWEGERARSARALSVVVANMDELADKIDRGEQEVRLQEGAVHRIRREIEQVEEDIASLVDSIPTWDSALASAVDALKQAEGQRASDQAAVEESRVNLDSATAHAQEARSATGQTSTRRDETIRAIESASREHAALLRSRPAQSADTRVVQTINVPKQFGPALAVSLGEMTEQSSRPGPEEPGPRPSPEPADDWRSRVWDVLAGRGCQPVGWLSDLVQVEDDASPVMAGLRTVLVMQDGQDLEGAWEHVAALEGLSVGHPPLRLVNREGDLRSATSRRAAPAEESQAVHREIALAEASSRLRRLEEELAKVEEELLDALSTEERASADLTLAQASFRDATLSLAASEAESHKAEHNVSAARERTAAAVVRLEELRSRAVKQAEDLAVAERALAESRRVMTADQERIGASVADRTAVQRDLEDLDERLRNAGHDLTLLERQIELESAERDRVRHRMTEARQERMRLEKLLHEAQAACEAFGRELLLAEESMAATRLELETAERELAEAPEETALPEGDDVTANLSTLHGQIEDVVRARERARLEQEQIESALNHLTQEALLDLNAHPEQLASPDPDRSFTDVEIRRLRIRAEQAEDIDPGVTQEYDSNLARRDAMLAQIEDLETAMSEIEDMLRDADREVRRRFRMAFSRVNDLFSLYFREIFGGGNAELTLESVDDVESVEINTQLPGKRARELSGLSGGERTLVAGAFLFSLISAAPPPFCILDEVDAALDETNVDRYVGVLKDLARETQFIVVTHNRGTMAAANSLYGIVLDEEAGSRAISLRLDEAVVEAGA